MPSAPWFGTSLMDAVQRDLADWPYGKLSKRSALLHLGGATTVTFSVRQKQLSTVSIHSCEFVVEGPVIRSMSGSIRAHQFGWRRRQPTRLIGGKGNVELASCLNGFSSPQQALGGLDYRRSSLVLDNSDWRCNIEPWAVSEVVCKMPPLRRYLRLEVQQWMLLLSVLVMINQAVNQQMDE